MSRRTRRPDDEKIMVYFGIDPNVCQVRRVWLTRRYTLIMELPDGTSVSHEIDRGHLPSTEIGILWKLTDVFGVPAVAAYSAATKVRIDELLIRAAEMKRD